MNTYFLRRRLSVDKTMDNKRNDIILEIRKLCVRVDLQVIKEVRLGEGRISNEESGATTSLWSSIGS